MKSDSLVALLRTVSDQLFKLKSCSHAQSLSCASHKHEEHCRWHDFFLMKIINAQRASSFWSCQLQWMLGVWMQAFPCCLCKSRNVCKKLWECIRVVSLDILGDKNTTTYITHQIFLPNLQELGILMRRSVQQPLSDSCHAIYRWNAPFLLQNFIRSKCGPFFFINNQHNRKKGLQT